MTLGVVASFWMKPFYYHNYYNNAIQIDSLVKLRRASLSSSSSSSLSPPAAVVVGRVDIVFVG
jgi:hypothetical protein